MAAGAGNTAGGAGGWVSCSAIMLRYRDLSSSSDRPFELRLAREGNFFFFFSPTSGSASEQVFVRIS